MIFPDVAIAFSGGRPFVLLSPRQIHPLGKIAHGNDSFGGHCAAIDRCHVPLGFGLDVRGRTFPSGRDLADSMGDSFPLDGSRQYFGAPNSGRTSGLQCE